ncbi:MAG: hypothetical protein HY376_03105 [Candidatus Blackburnbacteria bacterium]|nr:hypothetical protein [Candidatus Blackburnbacteria bacterium]
MIFKPVLLLGLVIVSTGCIADAEIRIFTEMNPEYIDSCCVRINRGSGTINSSLVFADDLLDNSSDWELDIEVEPDNRIPPFSVMCPVMFNAAEVPKMIFDGTEIDLVKCQNIPATIQVERKLKN